MRSVVRMAGVVAAAMTPLRRLIGGGAAAQSPAVSVAVPAPGGGGGVTGCYRVAHTIYGPYNFSFCLNGRGGGSYKVTGGGLNCNGGLDWYSAGGGRTEIDLYRTPRGRGTDRTGDSLTCRPLLQGGNVAARSAVHRRGDQRGGVPRRRSRLRVSPRSAAPTSRWRRLFADLGHRELIRLVRQERGEA